MHMPATTHTPSLSHTHSLTLTMPALPCTHTHTLSHSLTHSLTHSQCLHCPVISVSPPHSLLLSRQIFSASITTMLASVHRQNDACAHCAHRQTDTYTHIHRWSLFAHTYVEQPHANCLSTPAPLDALRSCWRRRGSHARRRRAAAAAAPWPTPYPLRAAPFS
jgi:hypothetical protein